MKSMLLAILAFGVLAHADNYDYEESAYDISNGDAYMINLSAGTPDVGLPMTIKIQPGQKELVLRGQQLQTDMVKSCKLSFEAKNFTRNFFSKKVRATDFYYVPARTSYSEEEIREKLIELGANPDVVEKVKGIEKLLVMLGALGGQLDTSASVEITVPNEFFTLKCSVVRKYSDVESFIEDLNNSTLSNKVSVDVEF